MSDNYTTCELRPGFRRKVVVTAQAGAVAAMLEDDMHCLAVILRHDGAQVLAVEALFDRAPWSTCPGAEAKLAETFAGCLLSEVTARRDKKQNCTHMHDMAVLAAAHAAEPGRFVYDILATDPIDAVREIELRRDGVLIHRWIERDSTFTAPPEIAGQTLFSLRDWIASLSGMEQESARLLQWSAIVAHGRTMSLAEQWDATKMPPNCYTFQPARAAQAQQLGVRRDFSTGEVAPLDGLEARVMALF